MDVDKIVDLRTLSIVLLLFFFVTTFRKLDSASVHKYKAYSDTPNRHNPHRSLSLWPLWRLWPSDIWYSRIENNRSGHLRIPLPPSIFSCRTGPSSVPIAISLSHNIFLNQSQEPLSRQFDFMFRWWINCARLYAEQTQRRIYYTYAK